MDDVDITHLLFFRFLLVGFGWSDKEDQELQRGNGQRLQVVYPSVLPPYTLYVKTLLPRSENIKKAIKRDMNVVISELGDARARMQTALDASIKDYHNIYMSQCV